MKEKLKLTPLALTYLKEEMGVDLFKGAHFDLEPTTLAHLYVAASQHWSTPVEFEDAMRADVIELLDELSPILDGIGNRNPPAKKKPRRVKTGG